MIEFGANIANIPQFQEMKLSQTCNLLFIGTNWIMKGGEKVLEIYQGTKNRGINCTLTIIGSNPKQKINDPNIKSILILIKQV